jgi:hypothetical protein
MIVEVVKRRKRMTMVGYEGQNNAVEEGQREEAIGKGDCMCGVLMFLGGMRG